MDQRLFKPNSSRRQLGTPTVFYDRLVNSIDNNSNERRNNHCSHNDSSDADEHGALHGLIRCT